MSTPTVSKRARKSGFTAAGALLRGRIRDASASKGFGQSRLLTQWEEIAGRKIAAMARPVEVTYGKGGMGATLVLLTTGAHAPVLQMELPRLRDKVNEIYGYTAISRIRVTQTAPTGFAEGQVAFAPAPAAARSGPGPEARREAQSHAAPVADDGLRAALEELGAHVLSRKT